MNGSGSHGGGSQRGGSHGGDRSVADAYLELLAHRGVEYLFGNGGTDFGPIIDAYARRVQADEAVPQPVTVPHEIPAMAMAHGYAMVSGKIPAVMVHTIAGTANAIGGLINANRAQVPIFFSAGRTPLTEGGALGARDMHIHWAQESFDQGSMVREWVKWDYELRDGADVVSVVDRALAVAGTEPYGPVYLTLPREVLAAPHDGSDVAVPKRMVPASTVAAPALIAAAADALAAAQRPIIITRSLGRDPEAVGALAALAESLGAPVYDPYPTNANLPFDHPLHVVAPPDGALAEADVIVVVDSDVPWTPKRQQPRPDATVIAVAADPLFSRYPVRGFRVDLNLAGSTRLTLSALHGELRRRAIDADAVAARRAEVAATNERLRAAADERAITAGRAAQLQKPWFTRCLQELLDDDAIIVDELGCDVTQLRGVGPGGFYGVSQAGVLGWSIGAALGAKLAARDRTVVAVTGDGSYLFGAPAATHWVARKMDLPVLFLVWNNAKWGAVEGATRMVYPDGWAVRTGSFPFSDLTPSLDHELLCQAAGGYGERVEDPAELPAALERGLKAVREGRQALLNLVAH